MTHAPRFTDDAPVALARHAIRLLDRQLKQEFGATALLGAEQEFAVLMPSLNSHHEESPFTIYHQQDGSTGSTASIARPHGERDSWFPESRRVNRSYREAATGAYWHQLEVVLTHQPANADGSPASHSPLTLARSIEALRHQLQRGDRGFLHGSDARLMQHYTNEQQRQQVQEVCFAPHIEGTAIFNGMHVNASLVDAKGQGLFDSDLTRKQHCLQSIGRLQAENLALLGNDAPSRARLQLRYGTSDMDGMNYCNQVLPRTNGTVHFLENQVPNGSSNPYYAVMLTMAGLLDGMQRHARGDAPDQPYAEQSFNELDAQTMADRFRHGRELRALLNRLEPELGDRFYDAIAKCPPGMERSLQEKRHLDRGPAR